MSVCLAGLCRETVVETPCLCFHTRHLPGSRDWGLPAGRGGRWELLVARQTPHPCECRTAGLQPSTGHRADLRHGCRGFLSSTKALVCEIRGRCRQRLLQHHVADQADRGDRGPLSRHSGGAGGQLGGCEVQGRDRSKVPEGRRLWSGRQKLPL